jgi:DNA-binding SARP family transcriptional activator
MPFEAKALPPRGNDPHATHHAFDDAARGRVTALDAPDGYLLTEGLASALARLGRRPVWLRLGAEDRDPGTFLVSLVTAARRSHRDLGQATLEQMRLRPGPIYGWPALFAQLAGELGGCLAEHGALVVEDVAHACERCRTLSLVRMHLIPTLESVAPCVLVAHHSPPPAGPCQCARRSTCEPRVPAAVVEQVLDEYAPALSGRVHDKALALIGGRASVLAGLRHVRAVVGDADLERLLKRVRNYAELLTRAAETLLANTDDEGRRALGLAVRLEYVHAAMPSAALGGGQILAGPWLQNLEDGWALLRGCWRQPLRAALSQRAVPSRDALHLAADWLLQAGADEPAISLYFELADPECAARAIAHGASRLMDLGQWVTLHDWLVQLPDNTFASYPELIYHQADIAAASGNSTIAKRGFAVAASRFATRNDVDGTCRSMLAASAAAADAGDLAEAGARARAVGYLAETANLTVIQSWAAWQHGRVALVTGDTDSALASFKQAASAAARSGDGPVAEPVASMGQLASQVEELRRHQESHREAQAALRFTEHQTLYQLIASVKMSGQRDDDLLRTYGWARAPAPLKLPGMSGPTEAASTRRPRWRSRFRRALLLLSRNDGDLPDGVAGIAGASSVDGSAERKDDDLSGPGGYPGARGHRGVRGFIRALGRHPAIPASPAGKRDRLRLAPAAATVPRVVAVPPVAVTTRWTELALPKLAVHLLGPLYVTIDDVPVQEWPSARCRSLFGYLLTHREPWPPREVLMEAFWPESSPEASRNSLNVAIHGLRRTLQTATDLPVIIHASGAYRVQPGLHLWLDIEEFDTRIERGRRLEEAGEHAKAAEEYQFADGLYRGDFLADDPYEDWTAPSRERLRLAHLDMLGRLSSLHFDVGRPAASASLCRRIIGLDPCREDAHRRLMRCYSRQGQPHLALMQYRACVRALAEELGVEADPATVELHDRIRRHEPV